DPLRRCPDGARDRAAGGNGAVLPLQGIVAVIRFTIIGADGTGAAGWNQAVYAVGDFLVLAVVLGAAPGLPIRLREGIARRKRARAGGAMAGDSVGASAILV